MAYCPQDSTFTSPILAFRLALKNQLIENSTQAAELKIQSRMLNLIIEAGGRF